jgi:hypothetical protein
MAQHTNVTPMTQEQRVDYARRLRIGAAKLRAENPPDEVSAEMCEWMADGYEQPAPE